MPTDTFHAKCVAIEDDEDSCLVGFADDEFDTRRHLQLQRARVSTPQDRDLGMDAYYVERDDQLYSCYGGIDACELREGGIRFEFSDTASQRLELDGSLDITFEVDASTLSALKDGLKTIFAGCDCYYDST